MKKYVGLLMQRQMTKHNSNQEEIQMPSRYMNSYPISFLRELKIKMKIWYYLTLTGTAIIKNHAQQQENDKL